MTAYQYTLEKGGKKHLCPSCNKKRFVRYVDIDTGKYLPLKYGRCDRVENCGYFLNPYKDGYNKQETNNTPSAYKPTPKQVKKKRNVFIPFHILKHTRTAYKDNVFIQNLLKNVPYPFEVEDLEKVIALYHLGTIQKGYRKGAITFPFIDIEKRIRTIQVKQFNKANKTTSTDFLHSMLTRHYKQQRKPLPKWLTAYNDNESKVSCLFGEHLLDKYRNNPIALVEAPKTAIYGTLYFGFPDSPSNLLWLAVYNLSSLKLEKCKVLEDRKVYLFPDLSKSGKAFELWSKKAKEFNHQIEDASFKVSNLLERLSSNQDKEQGKDIADYLIRQDWKAYRPNLTIKKTTPVKPIKHPILVKYSPYDEDFIINPVPSKPVELEELERYFLSVKQYPKKIQLKNITIDNVETFVKTHLETLKKQYRNPTFTPYLDRLKLLKSELQAVQD